MARKTQNTAPVVDETPEEEAAPEAAPKQTAAERKTARSLDRFPVLSEQDATWIAEHARPAISPCLCGCDTPTKGRFAPGHDAMLKERLVNTRDHGTPELAELATVALGRFGW